MKRNLEKKYTLCCQYCSSTIRVDETNLYVREGLTYFCSGDCEDKFAWFDGPYNYKHKEAQK